MFLTLYRMVLIQIISLKRFTVALNPNIGVFWLSGKHRFLNYESVCVVLYHCVHILCLLQVIMICATYDKIVLVEKDLTM